VKATISGSLHLTGAGCLYSPTGPGYAERWKVERTFAWLGNFRRLLARHERYLSAFRALYLVAFIVISLRRISDRLLQSYPKAVATGVKDRGGEA
jgi:anti-sigma-K factor RskA